MKTALVLSGGGSKAAFQEGALRVLFAQRYTFDVVAGVSAGALNGVMVASNQFHGLTRIWDSVREEDIYGPASIWRFAAQYALWKIGVKEPPLGFRSNSPLRQLLRRKLTGISFEAEFYAGRVSLESGQYVDEVEVENVVDQVLASSAIPGYVPPVKIGGEHYVDGGVRTISPLGRALTHDPDRVIIINCNRLGETSRRRAPDWALDVIDRSVHLATDEIFNNDIEQYLRLNRHVRFNAEHDLPLPKEDGTPYKHFETVLIEPSGDFDMGAGTDFDRSLIEARRAHGVEQAKRALAAASPASKRSPDETQSDNAQS